MSKLALVNEDYLKSGLTSIANATRSKANMTKKLAFPNEIVNAINNIPSSYSDNIYMLCDGETTDEFAPNYNTSFTITGHRMQGNYGLVMIGNSLVGNNANVGAMLLQTLRQAPISLADYDKFAIDIYISTPCPEGQFQINFISNESDGVSDGYNFLFSIANWSAGWHKVVFERNKIPMPVAADWTSIRKIRYTYFNINQVNNGVQFILDNFIAY